MTKALACFVFIGALIMLAGCSASDNSQAQVAFPIKTNIVATDSAAVESNSSSNFPIQPFLKDGGEKHDVGVLVYGIWNDFPDYSEVFKGILYGLSEIGWMRPIDQKLLYREDGTILEVIDMIKIIQEGNYSDYLNFSVDRYFDLEWDESTANGEKWDAFVKHPSGLEIIVGLGTGSGLVMSKKTDITIPTLADSISDPLGSNIIASYEDSGKDNLTVRVDPNRYLRQARMFYDVVGFKKLGVIYADTAEDRLYGAIGDLEKVAQEKGFELVRATDIIGTPELENFTLAEIEQRYLDAVRSLVGKVDAIYFGQANGLSSVTIPKILEILNKEKIPSFSMRGGAYVKQGILFGISESEETATGIHNARNIAQILHGRKPRSIKQIFEHVPHIAINLKEAERIGFDIPIDIIASSDEIYGSIE